MIQNQPPKIGLRILRWIYGEERFNEVAGDLLEIFNERMETSGRFLASVDFMKTVFLSFRNSDLRRNSCHYPINSWALLFNHFTIASRSLSRKWATSMINTAGLAFGLAAFFLVIHYVRFEQSYENFNPNAANTYRITLDIYKGSEFVVGNTGMYAGISPLLKERFPEVIDVVRFFPTGPQEVRFGDKIFHEDRIYYADPSVLDIFPIQIVQGYIHPEFSAPMEAILSESLAEKYFRNDKAIGRSIRIGNNLFEVIAVMKDPPSNTHFKFDLLLSHSSIHRLWAEYDENGYDGNSELTYALVSKESDLEIFNNKLRLFSTDLIEKIGDDVIVAQEIGDIHLKSAKSDEVEPKGSVQAVDFLLTIAFLILAIAWVNFINISTARSFERAREVGVRKMLGSLKGQLIQQFLLESTFVAMIAGCLAAILSYLLLPAFTSITGKPMPTDIFNDPVFWIMFGSVTLLGGFVTGLYPAFALSSFKPALVLKGKLQTSIQGRFLRKGLVVFQFVVTIVLLISVWTVYQQLEFLRRYNLGMVLDQTLVLRAPLVESDSIYKVKYETFKSSLLSRTQVQDASRSQSLPGLGLGEITTTGNVFKKGAQTSDKGTLYYIYSIDESFVPMFKMQFAAGRNFLGEPSDSKELILNEEAIRVLGFRDAGEAVGAKLSYFNREKTIIGVLRNFHQNAPKEKHIPMILRPIISGYYISLRVKTEGIQETISTVQSAWKEVFPNSPCDYFFLDEKYNLQYQADQNFGNLIATFSVIAVIIACLGLFGLSYLITSQRRQEIGIRKVVGASVSEILRLLAYDFVRLVIIAGFIALPVAYVAMSEWLQAYEVKIQLSWVAFLLTLASVMLMSLVSIGFPTLKAATTGPATSLRNEG